MATIGDAPSVEVRNRAELRAWLAENHARQRSAWLVTYRKHHGNHLPFEEVVEELMCWGWVDSSVRALDADRTMHFVSQRSPGSAWSAANKANVARARAAGAMTEAGEATIRAAQTNGMWAFLDDVERLEVPDDLAAALDGAALRPVWEDWPRSVKRATLEWIKTAKRAETRGARIAEVASSAEQGLRPKPFRR